MNSYMKLMALAVLLMAPMPVQAQATPSPALPEIGGTTLVGKADIVDGDTIEMSGRRIDLFGIDAPELIYKRNGREQTLLDGQPGNVIDKLLA